MAERPLACAAWQPALAGWLVAQVAPEEEDALSAHLDSCAVCRSEADSLLDVAALTLGADAGAPRPTPFGEQPPVDLGDRILARVARERRARGVGRAFVALAGVAAAVVAAVVVTREPDEAPVRGEEVSFARLADGVEAAAIVAPDAGGSLVHLTASGLDPDITYSLWLTPPGGSYEERIAAGTFRPDRDGEVDARLHCGLPAAEMGRVWATTPEGDIALDTEPA